jgi:hypothetical protein
MERGKGSAGKAGAIKNFLMKNAKDLSGESLFKRRLMENSIIEDPVLFFNFGKGGGKLKNGKIWTSFGEPDAILITRYFTVYFEFETDYFSQHSKSFDKVWPQLERFYLFGTSCFENDEYKNQMGNKTIRCRLRKGTKGLIRKMKGKNGKKPFFIICVTNDENPPPIYREKAQKFVKSNVEKIDRFGWMGYKGIKQWVIGKTVAKNWPNIPKVLDKQALKWSDLRKVWGKV